MKHKRTLLAGIFVAVIFSIAMLPGGLTAFAEEGTSNGLSKSKTSSEYELSKSNDTTTITLSLPSEEYLDTFDIVFVVDSSNESALVEEEASNLMASLLDEDLNVNIGVVKFKGAPQDTIDAVSGSSYSELTPLSDETRSYIEEAIDFNPDTDPRSTAGNGTNIHSALLVAEDWLDASDTPDDHKYVLLFTDGRAYIYDDGNGNPTSIYAQYHRSGITPNRLLYNGSPAISSNYESDKYHATIPGNVFKDADLKAEFLNSIVKFGTTSHSADEFQQLYDSTNSELTGTSPYETTCYYVGSGADKNNKLGDGVTQHTGVANWSTYFANGASLFQTYYEPTGTNDPYLELSPLKIDYDAESGTYSYLPELNPNFWMFHVSSEEKALYLAGHTWTDLGSKYHTFAVTNNRGYNAGLETCADFLLWLPENSELAAEVRNSAALAEAFDELENQLIYAVGKAVVTDEIPSYLDLVEDAYDGVPFKLTVGGTTLAATELGDNEWGFGQSTGDGYPYTILWNADSNTFTFNINVPVENANAVKLEYQLKWNGTGEEEVDVDTNASTTIEYWPSNDPEGESTTEEYVSPVVIYRSTVDYTVEKKWDDGDDADGIRPSSVEVQLYAGETAVGDPITLDASNNWKYTWEDLAKLADGEAVDYEVQEVAVPTGYEAQVSEEESGLEATITNSHTPQQPEPEPDTPADNPTDDSKKDATPKTGDELPVLPLGALVAASAAALGITSRKLASDARR